MSPPIETKIEQPNSIKISINAKGMYSGEVKVYGTTIDEAYDSAVTKAKQLENLIATKNNWTARGKNGRGKY